MVELARTVEGATDVKVEPQAGKRQVVIRPDRSALASYGISVDKVLGTLEPGVGGSTAGLVFDGIRRSDIFVRLQEDQRDRLDRIRALRLRALDGATIPLGLVFMLLSSAFGSARYAALIFLNTPFAVTGGIVSLFVSGLYLSVPAVVVIGGLVTSTLLTLVVLPSVYRWFAVPREQVEI